MVRAYSIDLKERVLDYLKNNNDVKATSLLFQMSPVTIYRWINRKNKKGTLQPIRREYAYKKIG